ncbi:MAG: nucleotidyltransferase domain-containing protein [Candidatus Aenigmatarchaeota archaeon]
MGKEKLVEIGEEVSEFLKDLGNVRAAAFYGSIGLGYHDEESDIDIVVYVDSLPGENKRSEILEERVNGFETQIDWMDIFHYRNVEFSLAYREISDLESDIDNHSSGDIATFIQNVKPIFDDGTVSRLRGEIENYPKEIREGKKVELRGVTGLFRDIEKFLEREQIAYIYSNFHTCLERIIKLVYSVNERYYPDDSLKWLDREMDRMNRVPEDIMEDVEEFVELGGVKNIPERLEILKKMLFSVLNVLENYDRDNLNIKDEEWYDDRIQGIRQAIESHGYMD